MIRIDLDSLKENQLFITEADDVDDSKIEIKPSEFSRLIGVSKQAVSAWIKAGKITISDDGYLNPNKAIAQLLKNGNPAKLRSKALMPLIKQIRVLNLMVKERDIKLQDLEEEVSFLTEANDEFILILAAIKSRLNLELNLLEKYKTKQVIQGFLLWLEAYQQNLSEEFTIAQFTVSAPVTSEKGAGFNYDSEIK